MSVEDNTAPDYGDFVDSDDECEVEDLPNLENGILRACTTPYVSETSSIRDIIKSINSPMVATLQSGWHTTFKRRAMWPSRFMFLESIDFNNRTVMWGICSFDNYNTDTKYEYLGRPQKIKLCLPSRSQAEIVKPIVVSKNLLRETVCLGDFEHAIKAGTSVTPKFHSPVGYCAPELFHNREPSFASDIWSYMCLFLGLFLGFRLFWSTGSPAIVSEIVDVLGPLPAHWKGGYKGVGTGDDSWYDQSRKPSDSLEAMIIHARPEISDTERSHVLSIMSKGFCYLPESCISAEQPQQDASFKAIMEIYER
ncbi:uncharacterized protein BP5553_03324 [Venustampulla echinocandica]|uniref:Protein kinase domain-containing protein n=1 Tax=Venustampulla echinocandica TaxID=2656787 RepID=A0A370TTZ6_9HELO|nr:uncharacterized protein BP5553_03324 [Venustampulla echinocandica]RDL38984.1 hypothetical protein BP5553_03324 [Venustampulla echinocandica]